MRAPLSRLPFLSVNASLGYRMTYFTESIQNRQQIEEPVTRKYADMRAEFVGPVDGGPDRLAGFGHRGR